MPELAESTEAVIVSMTEGLQPDALEAIRNNRAAYVEQHGYRCVGQSSCTPEQPQHLGVTSTYSCSCSCWCLVFRSDQLMRKCQVMWQSFVSLSKLLWSQPGSSVIYVSDTCCLSLCRYCEINQRLDPTRGASWNKVAAMLLFMHCSMYILALDSGNFNQFDNVN